MREFERTGGFLGIRRAADSVGLCARQFERRFKDLVGIPPKLFCRMQRFQRVFRPMEGTPTRWVSAAVDCGYFDQSHLIRDFREFSGRTQGVLLREEVELARLFAQSRGMSLLSKTAPEGL